MKKLEVQEEILSEFDEELWNSVVHKVEINVENVRVLLKNLAILKLE